MSEGLKVVPEPEFASLRMGSSNLQRPLRVMVKLMTSTF